MDNPLDWLLEPVTPSRFQQPSPPLPDPDADVLRFLDDSQRKRVIALLAVGVDDGWRPTHREVAEIVRSQCTGPARRSLDRHLLNRPDPTGHPGGAARTSDQP